jgi:hypothetical protein
MEKLFFKYINELIQSIENKDVSNLKSTSKKLVELSIKYESKILAQLAILSYCLFKILTKPHLNQNPKWPRLRSYILSVLKNKQFENISDILVEVYKLDVDFGYFIRNIVDKAKLKLASEAYALGMSLSASANYFDVNLFDLTQYIGEIKIHDEDRTPFGIYERLVILEKRLRL